MKYGEPWSDVVIHRASHGPIPAPHSLSDRERRIVAAINACAGLDLPDDVPVGALAELVRECKGMLADGGWVAPWYYTIGEALAKLEVQS